MNARLQTSHRGNRDNGRRGQALVETVVMLPILVTLILAIAYLKALTDTQIRAVEAARYVAWETTWSVRANSDDLTLKTEDQLMAQLRSMGLGRHLASVKLKRRDIRTFVSAMDGARPANDDTQPAPAFPDFLNQAFGGTNANQNAQDQNSFEGALNSLGSAANTVFDIGAAVAFPVHDVFGQLSNWDEETNQGMITTTVTYAFKGAGIFSTMPAINVRGFSTVLSSPYNVRRDTDESEYTAVWGAPDALFADSSAKVFRMWIFPDIGPFSQLAGGGGDGGLASAGSAIDGGLDFIRQLISAPGGILGQIPGIGTDGPGWHTPDGTLKEYPELHDTSTDTGSANGSGSGVGS
jgi:hypothetical protein